MGGAQGQPQQQVWCGAWCRVSCVLWCGVRNRVCCVVCGVVPDAVGGVLCAVWFCVWSVMRCCV